MQPKRIAVKFYLEPGSELSLEPFIPLFHRFIQTRAVDGLLVDVADYAHVPEGPGILLIGHDVDYAMDSTEGRPGLLTVAKRVPADADLGATLGDTLRRAVGAMASIEAEAAARFAAGRCTVRVFDRAGAPNSDDAFAALRTAAAPVFEKAFGAGSGLERSHANDARQAVTLEVSASEAIDLATLVQRTGARVGEASFEISAEALRDLRAAGDVVVVDVREPDEYETCNIGGTLIPLRTLAERIGELDPAAHIVVHCKGGLRAGRAVTMLREAGYGNAWNLEGGILAWIDRIDSSLTRY